MQTASLEISLPWLRVLGYSNGLLGNYSLYQLRSLFVSSQS